MRSRPSTIVTALSVVLAATLALTGCLTGPRPTLAEDSNIDAPVGDPAVDAVLAPFAGLNGATFTASYQVTNNFGPIQRDATVAQSADGRRSIAIGQVLFLLEPASSVTCVTRTENEGENSQLCTEGVNDASISDLQITHQFYGRSAAARLRTDAERRIGPTEGYQATFAGREARCVSIPVSGGSKVYCVLPEGMLAAYQGPDVLIELTGYEPVADESRFDRSGS
jgi:hypothetical protein